METVYVYTAWERDWGVEESNLHVAVYLHTWSVLFVSEMSQIDTYIIVTNRHLYYCNK